METRQHYEYLYTPKNESEFHGDFKAFVERRLRQFCRDSYANDDPLDNPFELDEVVEVCNKLPNGKAGGPDQLTYEDIKYGGHTLHDVLTKNFNAVRELEYVTSAWSVGSIFSLLKSGKRVNSIKTTIEVLHC